MEHSEHVCCMESFEVVPPPPPAVLPQQYFLQHQPQVDPHGHALSAVACAIPLPCLTPSSQLAVVTAGIALEQVVQPPIMPQQLQQQPLLLPLQPPQLQQQQQQQQVRPFACITCKQLVCCGHVCHVHISCTAILSFVSCMQVMISVPVQGHANPGVIQSWLDRLPPGAGPSSRLLLLCEAIMSGDSVTSDSLARHFYGGYFSDQV